MPPLWSCLPEMLVFIHAYLIRCCLSANVVFPGARRIDRSARRTLRRTVHMLSSTKAKLSKLGNELNDSINTPQADYEDEDVQLDDTKDNNDTKDTNDAGINDSETYTPTTVASPDVAALRAAYTEAAEAYARPGCANITPDDPECLDLNTKMYYSRLAFEKAQEDSVPALNELARKPQLDSQLAGTVSTEPDLGSNGSEEGASSDLSYDEEAQYADEGVSSQEVDYDSLIWGLVPYAVMILVVVILLGASEALD